MMDEVRAALVVLLSLLGGCSLLFEPKPPPGECPEAAIVAHYDFESSLSSSLLQDVSGNDHDGEIKGMLDPVDGPGETGLAARFAGSTAVVTENHRDFELERGSVSLWIRLEDDAPEQGLVSRDADGEGDGHFNLRTRDPGEGRRLTYRIQPGEAEVSACSEGTIESSVWYHVVANFGAPGAELFVDGARQRDCGDSSPHGIDGNGNPWVLGADSGGSNEGGSVELTDYFTGSMDELVLCSRRLRPEP